MHRVALFFLVVSTVTSLPQSYLLPQRDSDTPQVIEDSVPGPVHDLIDQFKDANRIRDMFSGMIENFLRSLGLPDIMSIENGTLATEEQPFAYVNSDGEIFSTFRKVFEKMRANLESAFEERFGFPAAENQTTSAFVKESTNYPEQEYSPYSVNKPEKENLKNEITNRKLGPWDEKENPGIVKSTAHKVPKMEAVDDKNGDERPIGDFGIDLTRLSDPPPSFLKTITDFANKSIYESARAPKDEPKSSFNFDPDVSVLSVIPDAAPHPVVAPPLNIAPLNPSEIPYPVNQPEIHPEIPYLGAVPREVLADPEIPEVPVFAPIPESVSPQHPADVFVVVANALSKQRSLEIPENPFPANPPKMPPKNPVEAMIQDVKFCGNDFDCGLNEVCLEREQPLGESISWQLFLF